MLQKHKTDGGAHPERLEGALDTSDEPDAEDSWGSSLQHYKCGQEITCENAQLRGHPSPLMPLELYESYLQRTFVGNHCILECYAKRTTHCSCLQYDTAGPITACWPMLGVRPGLAFVTGRATMRYLLTVLVRNGRMYHLPPGRCI